MSLPNRRLNFAWQSQFVLLSVSETHPDHYESSKMHFWFIKILWLTLDKLSWFSFTCWQHWCAVLEGVHSIQISTTTALESKSLLAKRKQTEFLLIFAVWKLWLWIWKCAGSGCAMVNCLHSSPYGETTIFAIWVLALSSGKSSITVQ